jgi:site-specific recombinase XerD
MNTPLKVHKKRLSAAEKACQSIPGFRDLYQQLEDKMRLDGNTTSTFKHYSQKLAQLSLHFGKLPQHISEEELNTYMASLIKQSKSPSLSEFKFIVFGMRYCYRLLGMDDKVVRLPRIKHEKKLPVVLSYQECKAIFSAPKSIKDRVLLCFIYSSGLRASEVSRMKISDIDTDRMMIHIRQSKYNKDRYVPLSPFVLLGLRKYYKSCRPVNYLFNGKEPGSPLSTMGMGSILRAAVKKCRLQKNITLHTLRHSYATHLLEFGMDIVTIKELLGHANIDTTLVYLHVAIPNRSNLFSPFDRLYLKG